jgi:hypothetical protein
MTLDELHTQMQAVGFDRPFTVLRSTDYDEYVMQCRKGDYNFYFTAFSDENNVLVSVAYHPSTGKPRGILGSWVGEIPWLMEQLKPYL